jgi:hypothetical protein
LRLGCLSNQPSNALHTYPPTRSYLSPSSGSCCSAALLREAGIENATSVVVSGLEGLEDRAAADAFVTSALLQVRGSCLHAAHTISTLSGWC